MSTEEYYDPIPEYYSDDPVDTGTSLSRVPDIAPIAVSNVNNRFMQRIDSRVETEAYKGRAKARLTAELIMNTTTLYRLGIDAMKIAPGAQKTIEHIINVYAASSAQGLAERWS